MLFQQKNLLELVIPLGIVFSTLIVGYIIRAVIFKRFMRWTKNTKTPLADIVVNAFKGPFIIWVSMIGVYLALRFSDLSAGSVRLAGKILLVLGIASVTLVLANITAHLVRVYSKKIETALPMTSLTQNISKLIIFAVGILIILNSLGISITPILATLGVGGLAVALALQETLSNIFAGFHIIVARQVRIGDYIKLESGEEGYVTDINWRTTQVRMLPNNVVLIPNAKLAQAIVTNFYLPDKELAVLVNLGVHYDSDLKKVEAVTCEVAKEVMKETNGGVPAFEPFIRYHTFSDSSINFTVILRAREFVDRYLVKHEFVKKLHERYNKEGIVIPYPIRAINYQQEKSG
ncbi:MAG: mechanosensitive ion channel family protein [Candidatus Omnitrophota bacterium]